MQHKIYILPLQPLSWLHADRLHFMPHRIDGRQLDDNLSDVL